MDLLSLILPPEVFRHFSLTNLQESAEQVDIYLDEVNTPPAGDCRYLSKGFTPYTTIQDYPLRGRAVYLHIRKRKWLDTSSSQVVTRSFDIAHQGTQLSKEFAAFLKEMY
jgi:transposase